MGKVTVMCHCHQCKYNEDGHCTAATIVIYDEGLDGCDCGTYRTDLSKHEKEEHNGKETLRQT